MSFRAAGFRHAGFRAALVLGFALHWGAAQAQGIPPARPSSSAPPPAPAARPGDAGTGRAKAAVCGACHGVDGHSSDPQYPDLAGQHESYIVRQLDNFKAGKRQNPIMAAMVVALSEQDMHDIGAYFAGKPPVPGTADPASATRGRTLFREGDATRGIPACMACHMIDGRGNPGAAYPQLAGQHARYVEATLKSWHDGASWGDDARARIMPSIARRLDPGDIAAVAGYIEGLRATSGEEAAPAAVH